MFRCFEARYQYLYIRDTLVRGTLCTYTSIHRITPRAQMDTRTHINTRYMEYTDWKYTLYFGGSLSLVVVWRVLGGRLHEILDTGRNSLFSSLFVFYFLDNTLLLSISRRLCFGFCVFVYFVFAFFFALVFFSVLLFVCLFLCTYVQALSLWYIFRTFSFPCSRYFIRKMKNARRNVVEEKTSSAIRVSRFLLSIRESETHTLAL